MSTFTAPAARQLDQHRRRDDIELHQQIGEVDIRRRLIDDDAHRAFGGMRADIDERAGKRSSRIAGMAISIWPSR